jgi:hypothetical protein
MMTFANRTYTIDELTLDRHVVELSVHHHSDADIQFEAYQPLNILISPRGAFFFTNEGLAPVREFWDAIPRIDDIRDGDSKPYVADRRDADEIIEQIKVRILDICPSWGKAIPGRRPSRSR